MIPEWLSPAVANHVWQSTLFAAAAWLVSLCLRRGPARLRYLVWLTALAKFAVPSALLVAIGAALVPDSPRAAGTWLVRIAEPLAPAPALTHAAAGTSAASLVVGALMLAWIGGAIAFFAQWYLRGRRFAASVAAGRRHTSGREAEIVERIRRRLGLVIWPVVVTCPDATEPGVWGVWRPVVILPEGLAERLSDGEFEMLVLHELIHVARRDNLVANLQRALCCCLWFYPLVWLLDRRVRAERESACDETVLLVENAADVYAASLLNVSRFCIESIGVAGRSAMAGPNIRRRIERIMTGEAQRRMTIGSRLAFGSAVMVLALASVAVGGSGRLQAEKTGPDNAKRQAAAEMLPAAREAMTAFKEKRSADDAPSVQVSVAVKRYDADTAIVALVYGATNDETLARYSRLRVDYRPITLDGGTSFTLLEGGKSTETNGVYETTMFIPVPAETNGLQLAIKVGDQETDGFNLIVDTPEEVVTATASMGVESGQ